MPIHICRNMIRRSSDGTTKPTKQRASSPPATQSSSTSFLTKTWYCFLWQLTPLDCGLILQHFLFDIKPTSPLTFTPPNLMPPWCNPNLCAYQAQKESSTWLITIGKLHTHTISTATRILPQSPLSPHPNNSNSLSQKNSHSISIMLHIHFMTNLFPLHPRAILIRPILISR
jgi:hypothetical protein